MQQSTHQLVLIIKLSTR